MPALVFLQIRGHLRRRTVNLVSHVHRIFPGGRLVEISTSLETSWSPILISVGSNLNRGELDELEQVIVGAICCRNPFLWPELFVNSSTAPYYVAMERQKQNGMV